MRVTIEKSHFTVMVFKTKLLGYVTRTLAGIPWFKVPVMEVLVARKVSTV